MLEQPLTSGQIQFRYSFICILPNAAMLHLLSAAFSIITSCSSSTYYLLLFLSYGQSTFLAVLQCSTV